MIASKRAIAYDQPGHHGRWPAYCESSNAKYSRETLKQRMMVPEVIEAYGSKRSCCDETEPLLLSPDHVNPDGADVRREHPHYTWAYAEARRQGWPLPLEAVRP